METEKNITVAFTGHRNYEHSADKALDALLVELYDEGYRRFMVGMSWGFDLAAGEAVVRLMSHAEGVRLVAVEPYAGFERLFKDEQKQRYERLIEKSDERIVVSQNGSKLSYIRRNDFLVDNSSVLVAWYDGGRKGGTAHTFKRAQRSGLRVENLYPVEPSLF